MPTANYILINGKHYSPNHPLAIAWMRQNRSETHQNDSDHAKTPPKRIRQSQKPLLNKLEQAFYDHLRASYHPATVTIYPQVLTVRLCNGVRYTPDLVMINTGSWVKCYEVKGNQQIQDDASVKIKMAAALFPQFNWFLVWKDKMGKWQQQTILP